MNFRKGYRKVYYSRNKAKLKSTEDEVEEEEVDYDELWDVGDIPLEEI